MPIDPHIDQAVESMETIVNREIEYGTDREEIARLCKSIRTLAKDGNIRFCAGRVDEAADIAYSARKHLRYGGRTAARGHLFSQIHRLKKAIGLHRL